MHMALFLIAAMTWARKLPTLMVCVPKRTSKITPLRLRIKCLLLLTLYDLIFLLSSKNLFKMVWWMGSQDICLPHSTSIIEGESDTSFKEKRGPRVYDFFSLRNLSKCNLMCWIITIPWGKWKKIFNRKLFKSLCSCVELWREHKRTLKN